jgi:hypothetical protein
LSKEASKSTAINVVNFPSRHQQAEKTSLGHERKINQTQSLPSHNQNEVNTVPTTLIQRIPPDQEYPNNIKVLTETSDDEQEELMKLIKAQNEKTIDNEVIDLFSKNRKRDQSLKGIMERKSPSKE